MGQGGPWALTKACHLEVRCVCVCVCVRVCVNVCVNGVWGPTGPHQVMSSEGEMRVWVCALVRVRVRMKVCVCVHVPLRVHERGGQEGDCGLSVHSLFEVERTF